MHAKLGQGEETAGDALFFNRLSDMASDRMVIVPTAEARSGYGEGRTPNWPTIIVIALVHAIVFAGLIKFDIVVIRKKPTILTVVDIAELAPPPIEKAAPPRDLPVESAVRFEEALIAQ